MTRWLPAVLVVGFTLLAACSDSSENNNQAADGVEIPSALPAGAADLDLNEDPVPEVVPASDCNAEASLAPPPERPLPGAMPEGTALESIAERGYLRAGVDQGAYLASYRDPLTETFAGFDVEVLQEIAGAIFGDTDPGRVQFTALTTSQRQRAVVNGAVDIVASTTTITCQRWSPDAYFDDDYIDQFPGVEFSAAYFVSEQRLLVPADSTIAGPDDLGGARICVLADTAAEQYIANYDLPSDSPPIELLTVDGSTDCLGLLQQDQVAAVTADETTLLGLMAQDPTLRLVGPGLSQQPYGLAMDLVTSNWSGL